jgi:hypothetical protein
MPNRFDTFSCRSIIVVGRKISIKSKLNTGFHGWSAISNSKCCTSFILRFNSLLSALDRINPGHSRWMLAEHHFISPNINLTVDDAKSSLSVQSTLIRIYEEKFNGLISDASIKTGMTALIFKNNLKCSATQYFSKLSSLTLIYEKNTI